MKKQFEQFYEQFSKDVIKFNINSILQKQFGEKNIFQSVKNYYSICQSYKEIYRYVINPIFIYIYQKIDGNTRPQILILFDCIDQIKAFRDYFEARASDFTSEQSQYLKPLTFGIIASRKYEDGKKVEMTIKETRDIMHKFRNNTINVLCATNIIVRGLDMRNVSFAINIGPPKFSQKEPDIDLDIYLRTLRFKGGFNDRGLMLTLAKKNDLIHWCRV